MRRIRSIGLGAVLITAAACSSGGTDNSGYKGGNQNPPSQPPGTPVMAATIEVQDDYFSPNSTLLAAGGTVTWTWVGNDGHSVTPDGATTFSPTAAVSLPPKSLAVTFPTTGDYRYLCTVHGVAGYYSAGTMIGAVYVR